MIMRYRIMLVFIVILLWLPVTAGAQDGGDVENWYFASGDGQLVAYTADGGVNVLIEEGVADERIYGWRLGPQTALVALSMSDDGGVYHFYVLTADAAQRLMLNFEAESDFYARQVAAMTLVAYRDPYAVLVESRALSGPAMLANLETGTIDQVEGAIYTIFDGRSTRFSADGQYLRYFSSDSPDCQTWAIRERTLETGETRSIHTLPANMPLISADTYGEQWTVRARPSGVNTDVLYRIDGSIDVLGERSPVFLLSGDDMLAYDAWPCSGGCGLRVMPPDGGGTTYTLPQITTQIEVLARPDETTLLVAVQYDLWLLESDGQNPEGTATLLGCHSPNATPTEDFFSPDGRWLLTVDSADAPTLFRVWDSVAGEYIIESDPFESYWLVVPTFGEGGFLLTQNTGRIVMLLYRVGDEAPRELPFESGGQYFDVLADGTVLYAQGPGSEALSAGIYRYDPDADTYTLLVEGGEPLAFQTVR